MDISAPTAQQPGPEDTGNAAVDDSAARGDYTARRNDLYGIIGFGLYLTWLYLILSCSATSVMNVSEVTETLLVVVFLLGEVSTAVLIGAVSKYLGNRKAVLALTVASCALSMLPSIACLASPTETLLFIAWYLAGFGSVILLSLWGFFLSRLSHQYAPSYTAFSALIAIILLGITRLCLKEDVTLLASVAIAFTSGLLFLLWASRLWREGKFVYPNKTRPPDGGSLLHSAGAMVANSFLLGFGFYALAVSGNGVGAVVIVCAMMGAAVFKVVDSRTGLKYQVDIIIKIIAPTAAICLLLLPFVPIWGRYCLVFLVVFIAMTDEIICWSAVSEYMHIHQVQPFANMAWGRFGDYIGLLLGFFCSSLIIGPSIEGDIAPCALISVIVIVFICLQAFFFKDNYTPFTEHKNMDDDYAEEQLLENGGNQYGVWEKCCSQFAKHYELTPRQTEVLFLLAKGYSMLSIEEQLVVSIHTVKAHVYAIYQKGDIHSRKELVEKIKEFEETSK